MISRQILTRSSIFIFLLVVLVAPSIVSANIITFDETDFLISTSTTSNTPLSSNPASAPAIPGDSTFTLLPNATEVGQSHPNYYFSANEGKFARYSFSLPAGYSGLTFSFESSVNDVFALYINDTVVAIQSSTGVENFFPILPGFSMNSAGVATDPSTKLEYLLTSGMQSLFQVGSNELTLFGRDTLSYGGFSTTYGEIAYNTSEPPTGVPEPATLMLVGLGLLSLVGIKRNITK